MVLLMFPKIHSFFHTFMLYNNSWLKSDLPQLPIASQKCRTSLEHPKRLAIQLHEKKTPRACKFASNINAPRFLKILSRFFFFVLLEALSKRIREMTNDGFSLHLEKLYSHDISVFSAHANVMAFFAVLSSARNRQCIQIRFAYLGNGFVDSTKSCSWKTSQSVSLRKRNF